MEKNKVLIIGFGSVGASIGYYFSQKKVSFSIWNRTKKNIDFIRDNKYAVIEGSLNHEVKIEKIYTSIEKAIEESNIFFITTPSEAHEEIGFFFNSKQNEKKYIYLVPGRTFGAINFLNAINTENIKDIFCSEFQTVPYACRIIKDTLHIVGRKKKLLFGSPQNVKISPFFDDVIESNYLDVTMNNIGAMLHPLNMLLNLSQVENEKVFKFYSEGMSNVTFRYIQKMEIEKERLCNKIGCTFISLEKWLEFEYDTTGTTLEEKIKSIKAYKNILAPNKINHRYIYDDIKTGLVPVLTMGESLGLDMFYIKSFVTFFGLLLDYDFIKNGRIYKKIGVSKWNLFQ